jgi:hypothetical protein
MIAVQIAARMRNAAGRYQGAATENARALGFGLTLPWRLEASPLKPCDLTRPPVLTYLKDTLERSSKKVLSSQTPVLFGMQETQ